MRRIAFAFTLVAPMMLAACGANPTPTATATVISREAASAEPGSSSPPTPAETPSSVGVKMGDSLVGKYATFTAKEGRSRDDGFGKTEWALKAEVCRNDVEPVKELTISPTPWSVRASNGGVYRATIGGSAEDILPSYPFDEPIRSGECLQGWMVFPVGDATVTEVHYRNDMGESAAWRVG